MKKIIGLHLIVMAIAGLYYLVLRLLEISCPIRALTDIPCPACGSTRSLLALLELDFSRSFYYHPVAFLLLFTIFMGIHKNTVFKFFPKKAFSVFFYLNIAIIIAVYAMRISFLLIP